MSEVPLYVPPKGGCLGSRFKVARLLKQIHSRLTNLSLAPRQPRRPGARPRKAQAAMQGDVRAYRGTSLIRKRPTPQGNHMTLDIFLL